MGFYYGTSSNSITKKVKSNSSLSEKDGNFTTNLTISNPEQTYYYKAYAVVSGTESFASDSKEIVASTSKEFLIGLEPSVVVTTTAANNVDYVSATLSASFSSATSVPSEVGFIYGTSESSMNSTIKAAQPSGKSGTYTINLDGLTPGCTYYFKAYAKVNGTGHFDSNETTGNGTVRNFTTLTVPEIDPVDPAVKHSWLELPGAKLGANQTVRTVSYNDQRNYTHLYDTKYMVSLWTAYPLNSSHMGSLSRPSKWYYHPDIDQSLQANLVDHSYSGDVYSKGHMIPNGSRNGIKEMQKQTFYVTNSVPQRQNKFNASIWSSLEQAIQAEAADEEIYIVTGVAFNKVGETKTIEYITPKDDISQNCAIPNYFYKVVLKVGKSGNTVTSASAIGFWFEHKDYTNTTYNDYAVSVDQIEQWTGFDFFVNLPDSVEASAETNANWSSFQSF